MKNTPVITVTCARDLPLLDLQAQSIEKYLDQNNPVYIVVNEEDPSLWLEYFKNHIEHRYKNHNLTVITKNEFPGDWWLWIPSNINPWAVGWEIQQILKLAIATKINSKYFLILDSQNFLIKPWSANYRGNKTPYRPGRYSMPIEVWHQYSESLSLNVPEPTEGYISLCTPIFMDTGLVQSLISTYGGVEQFVRWFKNASRIKSEFVLYALWVEKHGGIEKFHSIEKDWGNPMLRDSSNFAEDFEKFINFIGVVPSHSWVSANHRSWGDMTNDQYRRLLEKLGLYGLTPNFEDYRRNYVDYKF